VSLGFRQYKWFSKLTDFFRAFSALPWPKVLNIASVTKVNLTELRKHMQTHKNPCALFTPIPAASQSADDQRKYTQNYQLYLQFAAALETKTSVAFVQHGQKDAGILLMATTPPAPPNAPQNSPSRIRMFGLVFKEPVPFHKFALGSAPQTQQQQSAAPPPVASLPPASNAVQLPAAFAAAAASSSQSGQTAPPPQNMAGFSAPQNMAGAVNGSSAQEQSAQVILQQIMAQQAKANGTASQAVPAAVPNLGGLNPAMFAQLDPAQRARLAMMMQAAMKQNQQQRSFPSIAFGQASQPQQQQAQPPPPVAGAPQFSMPFGNPPAAALPSQQPASGQFNLAALQAQGIDMNMLAQMLQQRQQQR
jgi:hypothetical protein